MSAWRDPLTLTGGHVTLRPPARTDRDTILTALADVRPSFATIVPDAATIDAWHDAVEQQVAAGRGLSFVVLDTARVVAGVTRFLRMNECHRRVAIGGTVYAPYPTQRRQHQGKAVPGHPCFRRD